MTTLSKEDTRQKPPSPVCTLASGNVLPLRRIVRDRDTGEPKYPEHLSAVPEGDDDNPGPAAA